MHRLRPDGVAEVDVAGTMDLDWTRSWSASVEEISRTPGLRAVVLQGEGRFFCLGGDLDWMQRQPDRRAALHELASSLHEGVLRLVSVDVPIIARVHGSAAGAGMSLVLLADLVIAADDVSFTMAYSGVGLSPDGGASWLLPRIVGPRRAAEIILTNRTIKAEEAWQLGLVARVVPRGDLDKTCEALVVSLAAGPTASYAATKRLLARSDSTTLEEQLGFEATSIAELAGSETGHEGVNAFLERRPAVFHREAG